MKFVNFCDRSNNSLDVRFTKRCDNDCSFCIDKQGLGDLGNAPVQDLIDSTLKTKMETILILGGEPFLNPNKLEAYVKGIRPHVKEIFITTSLPKTIKKYGHQFSEIMRNIDGLNVSILDPSDSKRNNNLLNAKSKHDRLKMLEEMNKNWSYKIRTSINLVRGGIDNQSKLLMALTDLEIIGCEEIKIVELQNAGCDYISYEDIMGVKMKSPYSYGCQQKVDICGIHSKVILKRSCFVVEDSRDASFMDFIKTLIKKYLVKQKGRFSVMYENASIENNWVVV
jgi:molybdenum cofactor biosynthesis enzyme MoaA